MTKISINLLEHGLELKKGSKRLDGCSWVEVKRIMAFKRDLLTYDVICLEFDLGKRSIEVNEDMLGYKYLIEKLEYTFRKIDENWYVKIVKPAFKTKTTVLWDN